MAKSKSPSIPKNLPPGLDGYDLKILQLLEQNARITTKEISNKISLSPTPIYERIRKMETNGVIKQYVALINPAKVNKELTVICYVSLKEHSKKAGTKFIEAILNLPEILECYSISGEFDFMLKVVEENMQTYYDFHINKLSQIENVGHIQSVFVMGIIKDTHAVVSV